LCKGMRRCPSDPTHRAMKRHIALSILFAAGTFAAPGLRGQTIDTTPPRSAEALAERYRNAHARKDAKAITHLFYWGASTGRTHTLVTSFIAHDVANAIRGVAVKPPGPKELTEYTQDGVRYRITLTPTAKLVIDFLPRTERGRDLQFRTNLLLHRRSERRVLARDGRAGTTVVRSARRLDVTPALIDELVEGQQMSLLSANTGLRRLNEASFISLLSCGSPRSSSSPRSDSLDRQHPRRMLPRPKPFYRPGSAMSSGTSSTRCVRCSRAIFVSFPTASGWGLTHSWR
jgi:hypothetical protein